VKRINERGVLATKQLSEKNTHDINPVRASQNKRLGQIKRPDFTSSLSFILKNHNKIILLLPR
jgi:hypothetical protein